LEQGEKEVSINQLPGVLRGRNSFIIAPFIVHIGRCFSHTPDDEYTTCVYISLCVCICISTHFEAAFRTQTSAAAAVAAYLRANKPAGSLDVVSSLLQTAASVIFSIPAVKYNEHVTITTAIL